MDDGSTDEADARKLTRRADGYRRHETIRTSSSALTRSAAKSIRKSSLTLTVKLRRRATSVSGQGAQRRSKPRNLTPRCQATPAFQCQRESLPPLAEVLVCLLSGCPQCFLRVGAWPSIGRCPPSQKFTPLSAAHPTQADDTAGGDMRRGTCSAVAPKRTAVPHTCVRLAEARASGRDDMFNIFNWL
jgi:hypothetical protein